MFHRALSICYRLLMGTHYLRTHPGIPPTPLKPTTGSNNRAEMDKSIQSNGCDSEVDAHLAKCKNT